MGGTSTSHPGLSRDSRGSRVRSGRSAIQDLRDQRAQIDDPGKEYANKSDILYGLLAIALGAQVPPDLNPDIKRPRELDAQGKVVSRTDVEQYLIERKKLEKIEAEDNSLDGLPTNPVEVRTHDAKGPGMKILQVVLQAQVVTEVPESTVGLELIRDKRKDAEKRSYAAGIGNRRKQIRQVESFLERWNIWTSNLPIRDDAPTYTEAESSQGTGDYERIMRERMGQEGGTGGSDESA